MAQHGPRPAREGCLFLEQRHNSRVLHHQGVYPRHQWLRLLSGSYAAAAPVAPATKYLLLQDTRLLVLTTERQRNKFSCPSASINALTPQIYI